MSNKSDSKNYYLRLPAALHLALQKQAERNRRSLAKEIVFLLEKGIDRQAP